MDAKGVDPPDVWCVVLNWRSWPSTEACVSSILATFHPSGIVIVENESNRLTQSDTAIEVSSVNVEGTPCALIAVRANRGFAAGVNLGIKFALKQGADHILNVNNDLIVCPGAISNMSQTLSSVPNIGAVGARLYFPRKDGTVGLGGDLQCIGGGYLSIVRGTVRQRMKEVEPLSYITGACIMISAAAARATEGFDEHYFMYWEDVAWGIKVRQLGFRLAVAPDAPAIHDRSASRSTAGSLLDVYATWSSLIFVSSSRLRYSISSLLRLTTSCLANLLAGRISVTGAKIRGITFWVNHRTRAKGHEVVGELWG